MKRSDLRRYAIALLVVASCGRASSCGSPPAPAPPPVKPPAAMLGRMLGEPVNLELDVLYVTTKDPSTATVEGGISKARVRISPNLEHLLEVSVTEECINCAGDMWQATVRMASALASGAVGRALTDHEFKVAVQGTVDGPSAGALLAATMMAVILGDEPAKIKDRLKKVGMTGALSPDGTIAPVDGIPQKLLATVQDGKELFCYPYGQRHSMNVNSKSTEDIEQTAAQKHIPAREIGDIYQAYDCLMGQKFPLARAVDPKEMEYDFEAMRKVAMRWLDLSERAFGEAKKQPATPLLVKAAKEAQDAFERAENHLQQRMVPIGYVEAQQVLERYDAIRLVATLLGTCADGALPAKEKLEGIRKQFAKALEIKGQWQGFYQQLTAGEPRSVADAVVLVQAHAWATQSYVAMNRGEEAIAKYDSRDRKLTELCQPASLIELLGPLQYLAAAKLYLEAGQDVFSVDEKRGRTLRIDGDKLERLAQSYSSLADANWQLYRSLYITPGGKLTDDEDKIQRLLKYAYSSTRGKGVHAGLSRLAASLHAHLEVSLMLTRANPLISDRAKGSETLTDVLVSMLGRAELKSREAAFVAQSFTKMVPLPARFHYLLAQLQRDSTEGGREAKLQSLRSYWTSAAMSDLTRQMAQLDDASAPSDKPR